MRFGALRVFLSIKKYVEEDSDLDSTCSDIYNKHSDKSELEDNSTPVVRTKHQSEMIENISKQEGKITKRWTNRLKQKNMQPKN